jgi:hypothetical protein
MLQVPFRHETMKARTLLIVMCEYRRYGGSQSAADVYAISFFLARHCIWLYGSIARGCTKRSIEHWLGNSISSAFLSFFQKKNVDLTMSLCRPSIRSASSSRVILETSLTYPLFPQREECIGLKIRDRSTSVRKYRLRIFGRSKYELWSWL